MSVRGLRAAGSFWKSSVMVVAVAALAISMGLAGASDAHAVSAQKTKIHTKDRSIKMEANAWNTTFCPQDGLTTFICEFKTSAKTRNATNGKAKAVARIRNTYTARCSGIGISISVGNSGFGAGASVSSSEATNYVQNNKKAIVDKSGAVTCHIDPLRVAAEFLGLRGAGLFDRYTTGSYAEAWVAGSADHTSWAWTW